MKLIDITRTLAPEMAVWDGDQPYQLTKQLQLINGDAVNLTRIQVSAHMGTHVDAPYHFAQDGLTMENVPLEPYWGLAQVVTVGKTEGPLTPADFDHVDLTLAPRIIVNTKHSTRPMTQFYRNFAYPTPALADLLGQKGIILYGTDGPSMDYVDEPTMPGHHALRRNNIYILEGLDLRLAPDGLYEISAFPLKIAGGDGSPVRAVLKTLQ